MIHFFQICEYCGVKNPMDRVKCTCCSAPLNYREDTYVQRVHLTELKVIYGWNEITFYGKFSDGSGKNYKISNLEIIHGHPLVGMVMETLCREFHATEDEIIRLVGRKWI